MIKVSLRQLFESQFALANFKAQPLLATLTFKIEPVIDHIIDKLKLLEKVRVETVKKYGDEPDESGNCMVKKDLMDEFNQEWDSLLSEEIDLDINLLTKPDITTKGVAISYDDTKLLNWLIKQ